MAFKVVSDAFKLRGCFYDLLKGRGLEQRNYRQLQEERLKILVKHAYENVDLYRKKYDEARVKPEDIKSVEDIHKLPIITKDDLRRNSPQGILAKNVNPKKYFIASTSGATGSPVKIFKRKFKTIEFLLYAPLALLLLARVLKARIGRKIKKGIVAILAIEEDYDVSLYLKQVQKLPRFLRGALRIVDARDEPYEHLQALNKYQPNILISYPSVLKNMAVASRQEGLTLPQPKLLILGGELMDEHTRKAISDTFKGDIVEHYGAEEVGPIALRFPKCDGLHILCVACVLEVLKDGKPVPPGVPGNVVVTDLWNMATPIIRYSGLDDVVVLNDKGCSCGSKLPLLKVIEGRIVDSLILSNKRIIHPFSLTLALEHLPHIAKYQVIQEEIDKVRILIVEEKSSFEKAVSPFIEGGPLRSMIIDKFKKLLGEHVHITIDLVDDIPRPPGSRFYAVVRSLVEKPDY